MKTRTEIFYFDLKEKVRIKEIDRPGFIDSLCVDNLGQQYRVVYWSDGVRKSEWMYEREIESAE